jgi:fluoride exporter
LAVWQKLVLLSLAGVAGTLARFALSSVVQHLAGKSFPWGTLAVNALGCFLFGLVVGLATDPARISPDGRLILLTGFMGAFTTYSTFAFETTELLQQTQWGVAAINLAAQSILGVGLMVAGMRLGEL